MGSQDDIFELKLRRKADHHHPKQFRVLPMMSMHLHLLIDPTYKHDLGITFDR